MGTAEQPRGLRGGPNPIGREIFLLLILPKGFTQKFISTRKVWQASLES